MLEFITKELVEARLFKTPSNLEGRTAFELSRLVYASVLALEILRVESPLQANQYAVRTIAYGDFDHMRSTTTDLGNMISVLANQNNYKEEIQTRIGVYAPELQLRAWLRTFMYDSADRSYIRTFLFKLEGDLMVPGADLRQARRIVGDWRSASVSEHAVVRDTLRRVFTNAQLDIWQLFRAYYHQ